MKVPQFFSTQAGNAGFFLRNNSPTILTVTGIAGFAVTTALTIRSTFKAAPAISGLELELEKVKAKPLGEGTTEQDRKKEIVRTYATFSVEMLKVYWPTIAVGSASMICFTASHGIMQKRQSSLLAAYAALDASFKVYRQRVAEKFGTMEERELFRYGRVVDPDAPPCEILDDEDMLPLPSPYARFFDESSPNWKKTAEYNMFFLRSQQNWANDRLRAAGYLFLNEVYEALGLPKSQAGQIVGWRSEGSGDGFVDFGLYSIGDEASRAFTNLHEAVVLLDFNVDGPILGTVKWTR